MAATAFALAIYTGFVFYSWGMFGGAPRLQNELFTAIWNNDTNTVIRLIEKGADPNGPSTMLSRSTPLIDAAHFGNSGIVRLLLKKGADPNRTDRFGHAALYQALTSPFSQETDSIQYSSEIITNLLAHGASISGKDVMSAVSNIDAGDPRIQFFQDALNKKSHKSP